jgi:hypothetical protein
VKDMKKDGNVITDAAADAVSLGSDHAQVLKTVMDLWQLYTEHDNKRQARMTTAAVQW